MKKLTTLILSCAMACSFCACSSSSTSTTTTTETKENDNYPFKVDQFSYDVDIVDYTVTLENKSDYDVIKFEIVYNPIDWNAEDDTLFTDIYNAYGTSDDISESDTPGIINPYSDGAKSNEVSNPQDLYVGFGNYSDGFYSDNETPTDEQFDATEPAYLYLQVLVDDTLYDSIIDLKTNDWVDEEPVLETVNEWPDNELAQLIDQPEDCTFQAVYDEENDLLKVTIYNPDDDTINEYIQKCEDKGFAFDEATSESIGYAYYSNGEYFFLASYINRYDLFIALR